VRLRAPAGAAAPGAHKIEFKVEAVGDPELEREEHSTFILPRN
jgi:hypothetical protein